MLSRLQLKMPPRKPKRQPRQPSPTRSKRRSPLADVVETNGLIERIAEVIDDYAEANKITIHETLLALNYVHSTLLREASGVPKSKLH